LLVILAASLAASVPAAEEAAPAAAALESNGSVPSGVETSAVSVRSDRITGEFTGVPVEEALRQISLATGADVVGTVLESRQVTIKLDDVPLETALPRILGQQSFSLVFDAEGGLRRIRLISAAAPIAAVPGATRVAPAATPVVATPSQFMALEVPITTVGPLADALGQGGKATMGQLLEQAASNEDAAVRVAAVDAAMAAIERDGAMQSSIDRMLTGVDDQLLASLIRGSAGARSTELMSRVLSRTRRPEFRQRVVNVLRSLRETQS